MLKPGLDWLPVFLHCTITQHSRWRQAMQQAGEDTNVTRIQKWGQLLSKGLKTSREDNFQRGIEMYNELLICPDVEEKWHEKLLNLRAAEHFNSQQYEEAIVDLNQILEHAPNNSFVHFLLIMAYLNLGYTEKALAELKILLVKDSKFIIDFMDLTRLTLEKMELLKDEEDDT